MALGSYMSAGERLASNIAKRTKVGSAIRLFRQTRVGLGRFKAGALPNFTKGMKLGGIGGGKAAKLPSLSKNSYNA
jgi:hypothetical protein